MKKFILLITVITGLVASGFCQSDTSTAKINNGYASNQYLVKAENQKIGAWILLGAGAVSTSLAALRIPTALDGSQESSSGSFFLITGLAAFVGSITLFSTSSQNKEKGMELSFKNEKIQFLFKNGVVYRAIPLLGLSIRI